MTLPDNRSGPEVAQAMNQAAWPVVLKRLAIWGGFLAFLYLIRDFFFAAFVTFMISYTTITVVGWAMRRLSPHEDRPWLRRGLTVGFLVLVPLVLLGIGALAAPRLVVQAESVAGWLGRVDPETEVAGLFERSIGPRQFKTVYGSPESPKYREAMEKFRETGQRYVAEYNAFPSVEKWVESGFSRQFDRAERARIRAELARESTSSERFEQWFVNTKFPELQAQAHKEVSPSTALDSLVRSAGSSSAAQLLEQIRHDPAALNALHAEWLRDMQEKELAAARRSPAYAEQFREYYERRRAQAPKSVPYTYEQFVVLQTARAKGPRAFGDAFEHLGLAHDEDNEARLRADFETVKEHELFQQWWSTSLVGKLARRHLQTDLSAGGGASSAWMERFISSLINVPLDLTTAMLLSFFVCIDFPRLRQGVRQLRETWLRDVYDEIAPALSGLAQLIGRAMQAQGLIALCNSILIFIALTILGVEHQVLLSLAVFVLCLVPTIGVMIAWSLIVIVALAQPGGGFLLALKATLAVLLVLMAEIFVFSPRILGRMMELHPVLIIALLPLAQYFFGVWGLILATPVAVYVISVLIFRRGLPGHPSMEEHHEQPKLLDSELSKP
jgi:predicted PurR-regulated permease PerM